MSTASPPETGPPATGGPDLGGIAQGLVALCRDRSDDRSAAVSGLRSMPGHAGFSYGFTLTGVAGTEQLVLRLAPPGAPAAGPADVVRQARLLRFLETAAGGAVPVPPVRWYGDDPAYFGRPWSVVGMLPGRASSLDPTDPPGSPVTPGVAGQAVRALAALHTLDWARLPAGYGPPRLPADDVTRWDRFLARAAEPELLRLAPDLRGRLLGTVPARPRLGLFHGDFQWGNLLVEDGRLVAVLDWELAEAGAVLTDLGWLLLFSDPSSWAPDTVRIPSPRTPSQLVAAYRAEAPAPPREVAWFRGLAGYKFAAITGFNLMLHRRGKRPDPFWERLAPSAPYLLRRALDVLDGEGEPTD